VLRLACAEKNSGAHLFPYQADIVLCIMANQQKGGIMIINPVVSSINPAYAPISRVPAENLPSQNQFPAPVAENNHFLAPALVPSVNTEQQIVGQMLNTTA
jgi:hypothetical protein